VRTDRTKDHFPSFGHAAGDEHRLFAVRITPERLAGGGSSCSRVTMAQRYRENACPAHRSTLSADPGSSLWNSSA